MVETYSIKENPAGGARGAQGSAGGERPPGRRLHRFPRVRILIRVYVGSVKSKSARKSFAPRLDLADRYIK
jgi:hypothetical protein